MQNAKRCFEKGRSRGSWLMVSLTIKKLCIKVLNKLEWYRGKSKLGLLGKKVKLAISPQLAKIGPRLNPYYSQDYSFNHLCVSLPPLDFSHQLFSLSFPCATEHAFKAQLLCKCQVKNYENNTFFHVFIGCMLYGVILSWAGLCLWNTTLKACCFTE